MQAHVHCLSIYFLLSTAVIPIAVGSGLKFGGTRTCNVTFKFHYTFTISQINTLLKAAKIIACPKTMSESYKVKFYYAVSEFNITNI